MRSKALLLAGGTALLAAGADAGELRGTYFALEGGAAWVDDAAFFQRTATALGTINFVPFGASFESGWALLGSVGYALQGWRVEVEGGYRTADLAALVSSGLPVASSGEASAFTLMANLAYDIPVGDKLSLTLGAGAGGARTRFEASALSFSDEDWGFALQGIAGFTYRIAPGTQAALTYRYLSVEAPEFSSSVPAGTLQTVLSDRLEMHTLTAGIRFVFDAPKSAAPPPPATAAAPPEPPAPPAAAAPRQFLVFFGQNEHALVPEALRVIGDAANAARESGAAKVTITGHTDAAGSPAHNLRLSERRAEAVRRALVDAGIAASAIKAAGKGESELIVRTDDGVSEPQNRRAAIDLE